MVSPLQGAHLHVFFWGNVAKLTNLKPQKLLLGVVHRTCKDILLECQFNGFLPPCDPESSHLTVIIALSEYLPVICHQWLFFLPLWAFLVAVSN